MMRRFLNLSGVAKAVVCVIGMGALLSVIPVSAQEQPAGIKPIVLTPVSIGVSTPEERQIAALTSSTATKPPYVSFLGKYFPASASVSAPATQADTTLQRFALPLVSTASGLNLVGLGEDFPGYSDCCAPPDTNAAAGPSQVVETVNLSYVVYNKGTGAVEAGPFDLTSLFAGSGNECNGVISTNPSGFGVFATQSDPIVKYDQLAHQWVITFIAFEVFVSGSGGTAPVPPYLQCIATSTGTDATGTYNTVVWDVSGLAGSTPFGALNDYDKLAMWPDAYYITWNEFDIFGGGAFDGAATCAFSKPLATAAICGLFADSSGTPLAYSLLASDLDGGAGVPGSTYQPPAGSPNYLIDLSFNTANALDLWKFHVDFVTPSSSTITGPVTFAVAPYNFACGVSTTVCIPQPGTTTQLDSLDDRLMFRNAYRNFSFGRFRRESIVLSHTVAASAPTASVVTGSPCASAVRWYEIRNPGGVPSVFQQGTFQPDSKCRWMPSIGMDKVGDIAVGYSVSDASTTKPSIRYTGRKPKDVLGSMESEKAIKAGTGVQNGGLTRWGDYSSMAIDPADDCTFWYTQEYMAITGAFVWSTRLASFHFTPSCGGLPSSGVSGPTQ